MPDTSTSTMSRTEIAQRVRGIIAEQMGIAPIGCPESASVADLGLDSLDGLEVLMTVEESFVIDLSWSDSVLAGTVGEFIDLVEGQVRAGGIA